MVEHPLGICPRVLLLDPEVRLIHNFLRNCHTLIIGDFKTSLSTVDRATRPKRNREIRELTHVMTQMDLIDIYRILHPNIKEYTSFSAPDGTFSKIDHIFGHKANLNKHKKIGIIPCILLDYHGLKLEFNHNTNCRKPTNSWKLNSAQLNHPGSRKK